MNRARARSSGAVLACLLALAAGAIVASATTEAKPKPETPNAAKPKAPKNSGFPVEEVTIAEIQTAIKRNKVTTTEIVEAYLERIKAYNGTCVEQPEGLLGPVEMIPNAGQLNALITLNLRPETREEWGFDERKARSMTDSVDDDPEMPDAFEVAAELDAHFAKTRKLVGPLHGVVMSIKDQYDTFDMRTTAGADAFWADDRPPDDATVVERLRDAGAIILAKANLDEYAGGPARSSFGGTLCNPYDTERDPGGSSGGSATSVAANLVTCAIGEETGGSIQKPARQNNVVGVVTTRELVSADGMIQRGLNTRTGPLCRTVQDAARILDVIAGFDPADELTAFSTGRMPAEPYHSHTKRRLDGYRIGVIREYMDKSLFTLADVENIDIVDRAIDDLRDLGATIVDPGPHGALFQRCVDRYAPVWRNRFFTAQFPNQFPVDGNGQPADDHIETLVDMFFDLSLVPHSGTGQPSIRNLGPSSGDAGGARYNFNTYIRERGDAEIKSLTDLIEKANFWEDPNPVMPNRRNGLINANNARTLATGAAMQNRFTMQTIVHQCFARKKLDAVVYPSGNIPPAILTMPEEPTVNNRGLNWGAISGAGFPAMSVPTGFTTQVYDRDANRQLLPPKPAELPVGIDILSLPFREDIVFEIGTAYEAATGHRTPPVGFGPLD